MIDSILNIALVVGLVLCVIQDLKYRGIHIVLFPIILLLTLYSNYRMDLGWVDLLLSLTFLTVTIGILFLYIGLKESKMVNIFKKYLGIGDVLFFMAILPIFSFRNYILFFITGMILSMILHLLLNRFQKHTTIPLAGYLSVYTIVLMGYSAINSNPTFFKLNIL